ncbi:hypothetical protein A8E86_11905, partial [Burkholderia cenocepacia]
SFDARPAAARAAANAARDATAGIARGGTMRLSQKCHERDYSAARGRMKAVCRTIRRLRRERCATSTRELDWNQGRRVAARRPGEDRPATPAPGLPRRHRCDERRETARRR